MIHFFINWFRSIVGYTYKCGFTVKGSKKFVSELIIKSGRRFLIKPFFVVYDNTIQCLTTNGEHIVFELETGKLSGFENN